MSNVGGTLNAKTFNSIHNLDLQPGLRRVLLSLEQPSLRHVLNVIVRHFASLLLLYADVTTLW